MLTLRIEIIIHHNYESYYCDIFELILQNPNFIQNIKKLEFYIDCSLGFPHSSKWTIMFYQVNFEIMVHLDKAFEQLNVLKSVHIIYCTLNDSFAQQIVNLTKPFKLKSLFIDSTLQIMSLGLLLQKSDVYLESFAGYHGSDYDLSLKRKSLELIIKYCENIKFFNLCGFDKNLISLVSNLIENIKRYLNYLTIDICHLSNGSSIILQNSSVLN
ncbi:hypothetical protein RclHR1_08500007 [Rhizophagus clarus]|uniref:Uncharacterized protein n=1 Tax=Rhizophagus clarus TaxID=94130 RepID=A0A2Z6SG68_9GLOM|nr:hypothetical protein RclHR1_08500007 [Rhizophagus clarus]